MLVDGHTGHNVYEYTVMRILNIFSRITIFFGHECPKLLHILISELEFLK